MAWFWVFKEAVELVVGGPGRTLRGGASIQSS